MRHPLRLIGLLWLAHFPLASAALDLPATAQLTKHHVEEASSQRFPVSVFSPDGTRVHSIEGHVDQKSYTLPSTSLTTLQLLNPIVDGLTQEGFRSLFACADSICGGFDFRFMLDLLPEPMMHVDLGDFQYILLQHADERLVMLLTSRSQTSGYIQATAVSPEMAAVSDTHRERASTPNPSTPTANPRLSAANTDAIIQSLHDFGSIVLDDLIFATGTSKLGRGPFASLNAIAAFLKQTPDAHITFVGHTDTVGSLSGNVSLSKKRATSARDRLMEAYGVSAKQIHAEGVGYLAPRASNADEQGRDKNRRVEAVLTSTPQK